MSARLLILFSKMGLGSAGHRQWSNIICDI